MVGENIYLYIYIYLKEHVACAWPDAVSTQLPILKPNSSPCCKTFFWAPRFKIQNPPVLVDAISSEGSRPIGAPASTLGCRIGRVRVDVFKQTIAQPS